MTDNLKPSADYAAGWRDALTLAQNRIASLIVGTIASGLYERKEGLRDAEDILTALTAPEVHAAALDKMLAEARAEGVREAVIADRTEDEIWNEAIEAAAKASHDATTHPSAYACKAAIINLKRPHKGGEHE